MKYQVCRPLTPIEFEALKADIAENGVLVPVEVDEDGEILDGHHRVRAWQELREEGVTVPKWSTLIRRGLTEEEKRNHARKLNLLRRQMDLGERKRLIEELAKDGGTLEEIGEAAGISSVAARATLNKLNVDRPAKVKGKDGKIRKTRYASRKPKPMTLFKAGDSVQIQPDLPLTASNHAVSFASNYDGDEWYTPIEYIEAARTVMGEIDLDPASCDEAQEYVRAAKYITKQQDALRDGLDWHGRAWLNPPYSMPLIKQFVTKLIDQYENGNVTEAIILTNNSSDTGWFHDLLSRYPACFTRGRVQFWRPDSDAFGARQGQTLFYLGDDFDAFRFTFSQFGQVVIKA